ncbi:MAG: hypothetical protein RJA98_585 [Pseudomonadota bacterium]|jgi:MOSC domain-containing protein YiiM
MSTAPLRQAVSVNTGRVRPLMVSGHKTMSAIGKQPVAGRVAVGPLGLAGDEQADPRYHGGVAKAVYAYPSEHLPFWATVRAQAGVTTLWDEPVPPGLLGENLTLAGLLETQVWVGDVLRFPDCELAVSEPRSPCNKLGAALGFAQAKALMNANAWCGFYLLVRRPGTLAAGEAFELVPGPREVGISELFRARVAAQRR